MKLQEKILYSRKKAGLSQEALAEQLGVSRQAISKWETGDAIPEISKLVALAKAFGVTTDWLLSEDDTDFEPERNTQYSNGYNRNSFDSTYPSWIDVLPGTIKRLVHMYGWLGGVYMAVVGTGITLMGALARFLVKRMLGGFMMDDFFMGSGDPFGSIIQNNPVSIMGSIMMIVGIVLIIGGVSIAVILKKQNKNLI